MNINHINKLDELVFELVDLTGDLANLKLWSMVVDC